MPGSAGSTTPASPTTTSATPITQSAIVIVPSVLDSEPGARHNKPAPRGGASLGDNSTGRRGEAMKRLGLPVVMTVLALAPLLRGQSALEVKAPESVGFSASTGCSVSTTPCPPRPWTRRCWPGWSRSSPATAR